MTGKETIRDALVYRLKNHRTDSEDNFGLGLFWAFALALPVVAIIAVCTTVYYSLKLFT